MVCGILKVELFWYWRDERNWDNIYITQNGRPLLTQIPPIRADQESCGLSGILV